MLIERVLLACERAFELAGQSCDELQCTLCFLNWNPQSLRREYCTWCRRQQARSELQVPYSDVIMVGTKQFRFAIMKGGDSLPSYSVVHSQETSLVDQTNLLGSHPCVSSRSQPHSWCCCSWQGGVRCLFASYVTPGGQKPAFAVNVQDDSATNRGYSKGQYLFELFPPRIPAVSSAERIRESVKEKGMTAKTQILGLPCLPLPRLEQR